MSLAQAAGLLQELWPYWRYAAVASLIVLVAELVAAWSSAESRRRSADRLALGGVAMFMLSAAHGLQLVRSQIVESAPGDQGFLSAYASIELRVLLLDALLLMAWCALRSVRSARSVVVAAKQRIPIEPGILWPGVFALMLGLSSTLVASTQWQRLSLQPPGGFLLSAARPVARLIAAQGLALQTGQVWLVTLALVTAVVLTLLAVRGLVASSSGRQLGWAIALFAVGCTAWMVTRGLAKDARQPIALEGIRELSLPCSQPTADLSSEHYPKLSRCQPPSGTLGPTLAFRVDGTLDAPTSGLAPSSERDVGALREALTESMRNWKMLYADEVALPMLIVRAASATPFARLAPALSIASELGLVRLQVCGAPDVRTFDTATLGPIQTRAACGVEIVLGPSAAGGGAETWGEIVRAAGSLRGAK